MKEHWQSDPHIRLEKYPAGTRFILRLPNEQELLCELDAHFDGSPLTATRVITSGTVFLGQHRKALWKLAK